MDGLGRWRRVVRGVGIAIICIGVSAAAAKNSTRKSQSVSLLQNPGPEYLAARVLAFAPGKKLSQCGPGTTLTEADRVGMPAQICARGYECIGGVHIPAASNGACASYYIDTRAGWDINEYGRHPGWDLKVVSGGDGKPIVYRFQNQAVSMPFVCKLREIGVVYQGYDGAVGQNSHFRRNADGSAMTMGQFSHVIGTFSAAVDVSTREPSQCASTPTAYISADFHIAYPRRGHPTELVYRQLLGVIVYGMKGLSLYGKSDVSLSFWCGDIHKTKGCLLHGDVLAKIMNESFMHLPELDKKFQTVRIDYKMIFEKAMTPPVGYKLDDAIITGFDVYSSVRGANLDFSVQGIDVVGVH